MQMQRRIKDKLDHPSSVKDLITLNIPLIVPETEALLSVDTFRINLIHRIDINKELITAAAHATSQNETIARK